MVKPKIPQRLPPAAGFILTLGIKCLLIIGPFFDLGSKSGAVNRPVLGGKKFPDTVFEFPVIGSKIPCYLRPKSNPFLAEMAELPALVGQSRAGFGRNVKISLLRPPVSRQPAGLARKPGDSIQRSGGRVWVGIREIRCFWVSRGDSDAQASTTSRNFSAFPVSRRAGTGWLGD
jgi:hypothetical protein